MKKNNQKTVAMTDEQWTRCADEMPLSHLSVLGYGEESQRQYVCYYDEDDDQWKLDYRSIPLSDITHWQYLPDNPI